MHGLGVRVAWSHRPIGRRWSHCHEWQALANRGALHSLMLTMKKHPASFRLTDEVIDARRASAVDAPAGAEEVVVYEGPVRGLCPLAPVCLASIP